MKREKKMGRKSTLTMACMLWTVGCTGLQTNNENDSKTRKNNNDFSSNSNDDNKDDASNKAPFLKGVPGGTGTGTGGDEDIPDEVQFFAIEQKPMFEQCKDEPKDQQEKCF